MTVMMTSLSYIRRCLAPAIAPATALLVLLSLTAAVRAAPPVPFSAEYSARYGGFRASAERSLQITAPGRVEMTTSLALKLFGQSLSRIHERSVLADDGDAYRPLDYTFEQTGLGKRKRQISFDWNAAAALATVDGDSVEIPLAGPTLDNLSAYLEIDRQLRQGRRDIVFDVIDKGELEESRFRVLGEETISTGVGDLDTVKLEKVRGKDSDRHTQVWLARDWDYLLVKLVQEEPDSRTIRLDIRQATVGGEAVAGIAAD